MAELTKERLQEIAEDGFIKHGEAKAMARQLLAGMEQEPVAYMYKDKLHTDVRFSLHTRFGNWSQENINEYEITEIPLYAAPQLPQPAVVDEVLSICQRLINRYVANKDTNSEFICCVTPERSSIGTGGVWDDWKALDEACSAAMLQGKAEPVSQPYTLPAGMVAVPVEPTREMIEATFVGEMEPQSVQHQIRNRERRAQYYRAMLAAAPDFRGISNSSTGHFRESAETSTKCWCHTCRPVTMANMRFVVCPECGNKRCPHANDHRNACTGSNEPGQEGSAYPAPQ